MNIRAWITLSLTLGTAPAMADAVYDYARVIKSEPIVRYVTVRTPVQECWEETEYYSVTQRPRGTAGGAIVGAIIGGVIGHQFGHGHSQDHATVFGSLAGAAIGSEVAVALDHEGGGITDGNEGGDTAGKREKATGSHQNNQ